MKRLGTFAASLWLALAGAASADGPVVVELFTSQGCSSCPPADNLLGQIAERDDIIALALHVDYWDYIGWKDEFADPAHTTRQRAYSRVAGKRTIYTPQMVIGGEDHIVGTKAMRLADLLNAHRARPNPADVSVRRDGDRIRISATANSGIPSGAVVHVVTYTSEQTVSIRRGENAGRTLPYHNVVDQWVTVGNWDGRGTYRATVQVPRGVEVAVLVQAEGHGRMLGAAKLR
ncbi:MAG: DUF1223 domain-containing protein [Pseudomonadota bacterium]